MFEGDGLEAKPQIVMLTIKVHTASTRLKITRLRCFDMTYTVTQPSRLGRLVCDTLGEKRLDFAATILTFASSIPAKSPRR